MKTAQDPRHQNRINRMNKLFSFSFNESLTEASIDQILPVLSQIDEIIKATAPEWPLEKIARIDLAILRLALFELNFEKKEPPKVIIDEAVELAKQFGNEHSPHFVNGVLGTVYKKQE